MPATPARTIVAIGIGLSLGIVILMIGPRFLPHRTDQDQERGVIDIAFYRETKDAWPPDGWNGCGDGFKIVVGVTDKIVNPDVEVDRIEKSVNSAITAVNQSVSMVAVPLTQDVVGDPCDVAKSLHAGNWSSVTTVADADLFGILMTSNQKGVAGCALAVGATKTERHFAVNFSSSRAPTYTLAHEVGHLAGGGHEPGGNVTGRFPYAYGYLSENGTPPYRTIMSDCGTSTVCPGRENLFSDGDPLATPVNGTQPGSASQDMVRVLRTAIPYLASLSCP